MVPDPQSPKAPDGLIKSMIAQALREKRRVRLRFGGLSMSPLLMPGDEILVEPLVGLPRRGDIALFMSSGQFVAHRVLSVRKGREPKVRLKGDAVRCGFEDMPVRSLLGIVAARRRAGRTADFRSAGFRAAFAGMAILSPFAAAVLSGMPGPVRATARRALDAAARLL